MTVNSQERSNIAQVIQVTSGLVEASQAKLKIGTDCIYHKLGPQASSGNMDLALVTRKNLHKFFIFLPGIEAPRQSSEHAILKPNYLGPLLSQPTTTNKPTTHYRFADIWPQITGEVQHRHALDAILPVPAVSA